MGLPPVGKTPVSPVSEYLEADEWLSISRRWRSRVLTEAETDRDGCDFRQR